MFNIYIKIAWRNLKQNAGYSFINIFGLAVGIACILFVSFYVKQLFSYDKYHQDYKRVYRVGLNVTSNNETTGYAFNIPPLAPNLEAQYSQVEAAARIFYWNSLRTVKYNEKLFYEDGFAYTDNELFKILTYNFIQGNPQNALEKPLSLVIPVSLSNKIFGTQFSLNKTLNVDGKDYTITGVIEDIPDNTHMPVDIFVSMDDLNNPPWLNSWDWPAMYTYVKVKENTNIREFENSIKGIIEENLNANSIATQSKFEIFLQPISDIYLHSNLEYELNAENSQLPVILITLGFFIIAIASFNYINLATVRMIKRFKEIGMRKILGAGRGQLFLQFMNESFLMIMLASVLAVIFLILALPILNEMTGADFRLFMYLNWNLVFVFAAIVIVLGILSGIYPAIVLFSFSPSKAITEKSIAFKGNRVRRALVIGQFVMSIGLIFGALVAASQIQYLKNSNPGFNKDSKIIIPVYGSSSLSKSFSNIKDDFQRISGVINATVSSSVPGQGVGAHKTKSADNGNQVEQIMYYYFVDSDFFSFYNIKIEEGRSFYPESEKDITESCIINKSAAEIFGWNKEDAIGKQIVTGLRNTTKTVVGVIDDFHFRGLQFRVEPLIIEMDPAMFTCISLSTNESKLSLIIKQIEKIYKDRFAGKPFVYFSLDEYWNGLYKPEEKTGMILNIFTLLSILIAALGLFGLASFIVETKKKEIGVRKVLGCSTTGILVFMMNRFVKWIIIANLLSLPFAYWAMNNWLQNYPYRINIKLWMILMSVAISLGLMVLAVIYQSIKAAQANPVDSLKYE